MNIFTNSYFSCTFKAPKIWHQSQIIPMPKKGDLSLVTNYRGISLMSIAAKLYNKMILNRIVPFLNLYYGRTKTDSDVGAQH